jgi:septum formation protein
MKLYLASSSPRRADLLRKLGIEFEIMHPAIDESGFDALVPENLIELARAKAVDVIKKNNIEEGFVIGADTVVILDGAVIGKPADDADARNILTSLSGKTHVVRTAIVVADVLGENGETHIEETKVTFFDLSPEDIQWYLATEEQRDKAGAYGIQGQGGLLVKSIEGDYYNIVGLPIAPLWRLLRDRGL